MSEPKLLKYASCKKTDRRIEMTAWETSDGIAVQIKTKRLADKKTRHIVESSVLYGYQTLAIMHDLINMLFDDPEFKMKTNRELGQMQKEGKWNVSTNIEH